MFGKKTALPTAADALPGRETPMPVPDAHYVTGRPLRPPFPEQMQQLQVLALRRDRQVRLDRARKSRGAGEVHFRRLFHTASESSAADTCEVSPRGPA